MSPPVLPGEAKFWDLAEPLLVRPEVTRSTMMGLPCLRWNGAFFASCDRRTGDLLIKLAETRVDELVAAEQAKPFAGRPPVPGMGSHPRSSIEELEAPPRRSTRGRDQPSGSSQEEAVTAFTGFPDEHGTGPADSPPTSPASTSTTTSSTDGPATG